MEIILIKENRWRSDPAEFRAIKNIVEKYITWDCIPGYYYKPGRSCWIKLSDPIKLHTPNKPILVKSIKLKGAGYCDHTQRIHKPCLKSFYRPYKHVGFTNDGELVDIEGSSSPLGGMTLEKALSEFNTSETLVREGCPSEIPLFAYKFQDSKFFFKEKNNEYPKSMGVFAAGLPTNTCQRVSSLFRYEKLLDAKETVDTWSKIENVNHEKHWKLLLLSKFIGKFGSTLRRFHEIGFYRHSGSLGNIAYNENTKSVFLMDLDACCKLDTCDSNIQSLQIIRDIASIYQHLLSRLMRREIIDGFSPSIFMKYSPVKELLSNYYADLSSDTLKYAIEDLHGYYQITYKKAMNSHMAEKDMWGDETIANLNIKKNNLSFNQYRKLTKTEKYWLNKRDLYCKVLHVLWGLHEKSSLNNTYPHSINYEQFKYNIEKYNESKIPL